MADKRGSGGLMAPFGAVAALAVLGSVYFAHIQPGLLTPGHPIKIVEPLDAGPHPLFVYGTLRSPAVRLIVAGRAMDGEPALLPGFRRVDRDIRSQADAAVEGYLVHVTTPELRRLDRYERTGQRYERIEVLLDDGRPAWVYRLLADERPNAATESAR